MSRDVPGAVPATPRGGKQGAVRQEHATVLKLLVINSQGAGGAGRAVPLAFLIAAVGVLLVAHGGVYGGRTR